MDSIPPRRHLTLVGSDGPPRPGIPRAESSDYQVELLSAWEAQQAILNYSAGTIALNLQTVQDFLAATGAFVWELTRGDLDRFYLRLIGRGLAYSTRRRYGAALGAFLDYLRTRRGPEIWARYGVVVPDIVDKYNRHRQRADDRDAQVPPPAQETVGYVFAWLRQELQTCRKWAPAARDYAVLRVLYCAGLRVSEAVLLDADDVHFGLGPLGKLHVRHGKGARGSGPRRRWVPLLNGLDATLRWYLDEVRPRFPAGADALFPTESGERLSARTVRASLQRKLRAAGVDGARRFSPHGLRRACATHNCEEGLELLAMQQLLGHEYIGTTMAYVRPSESFIERCYREALDRRLERLGGGDAVGRP
jgi:integrase/recombinase XerD